MRNVFNKKQKFKAKEVIPVINENTQLKNRLRLKVNGTNLVVYWKDVRTKKFQTNFYLVMPLTREQLSDDVSQPTMHSKQTIDKVRLTEAETEIAIGVIPRPDRVRVGHKTTVIKFMKEEKLNAQRDQRPFNINIARPIIHRRYVNWIRQN